MKKKIALLVTFILAFVVSLAVFAGCGTKEEVTVNGLRDAISLQVGKTYNLSATASDGSELVWASDKTDVATVDANGKVTAVKAGEANVTATVKSGTASASCKVTVKDVEIVTVKQDGTAVTSLTLASGESATLTAEGSLGSKITWSTSDANVVTVKDGVVTAVFPGTAKITASVSASEKAEVDVTVSGTAPTDLEKESSWNNYAKAKAVPGTFTYWVNSWVTATAIGNGDMMKIEFSNNAGNWYDTWIFYDGSANTADELYEMKVQIDSSSSGRVTICGNVIELEEGRHEYSMYIQQSSAEPSLKIVFGVTNEDNQQDIKEGTVIVYKPVFTKYTGEVEKLATPTLAISDENVITITDTNEAAKVGSYEIGLFNEDTLARTITVANGDTLDPATVLKGEYTAKVRAVAANLLYTTSDWSEGVAFTGTQDKYDLTFAGEDAAEADPGTWYYWRDQAGWVGGNVDVTKAEYNAGSITIAYTSESWAYQHVQIFYEYSDHTVGKPYTYRMTINASAAGKITVCGTVVELEEGNNNIEVSRIEAAGSTSIAIQLGAMVDGSPTNIEAGEFTISNITCEEVTAEAVKLDVPTFTVSDENVIAITDTNEAGVQKYELGLYQEDTLVKTLVVHDGYTIDVAALKAGEYTAKIRAVSSNTILYTTSDWSTETVTITGTNTDNKETLLNGAESNSVNDPGKWYEWHDQNWCGTSVTLNGDVELVNENSITANVSSTAGDCNFGFQLFYTQDDADKAQNYATVTLTITVTVDCTISVNGQSESLTAGTAHTWTNVTLDSGTNGSSIAIVCNVAGLSNVGITVSDITFNAAAAE